MKNNIPKLVFHFSILLCLIILVTCVKLEKEMLVTTGEVANVLTNTAEASGLIVDLGDGATQHGHCYATTPNVTTTGSKTVLGLPAGTGGFTSQLTNLSAGTKYYIKAYISNGTKTVYGEEVSFITVAASVPALTTTAISSITATTAASGGNITSEGGAPVTAKGVCWSTTASPTTSSSKTTDGTGSGIFTSNLAGLTTNTTYYVRAYATNSAGTAYGNELTFTSGYFSPTITTSAISSVTSNSASSGGNITSDGGAAVTVRGVCWNTSANPTVANNKTTDGATTGIFVSAIAGLTPGTTYYVRAYATNSAGTAYGNELTLTATALLPTLTTTLISAITSSTATSGGNVTSDGGASVTSKGVCWSTAANPEITGSKSNEGPGIENFVSNLTGLTPGTTYYVRAYATNSAGTAYGNELSFAASAALPTLTTTTPSAITATTATSGGNISSEGGASVTTRGVCWSTSANPTTADNTTSNNTGSGSFLSSLTGLTSNTTYYVKAYAINSAGTAYGNQVNFKTTIILPTVTTDDASLITATSATSGGNVTSEGGASVTAKGVCWNTATNPTIDNSKTNDGAGLGTFTSPITGLTHGTTYYVRAYATNSGGTSYGNEISFTATIELPTLTSLAITSVTATTASSGGNITDDGGASVTARGVCWSTSPNPTISNDKTTDGLGTGAFISNMTGLTPTTTYYVRVYATNSAGTSYTTALIFKTFTGTVTDIDGNIYNTITIDTKLWMAENLKTIKYNDGTAIPLVTDGAAWVALTTPGYCWYNNNAVTYKATYGALYNWYTVNTGKLCPTGWHVPTDTEWTTLTTYLGGVSVAGGKMKETGTSHWLSPNTGATNESGYTALAGGYRYFNNGLFHEVGESGQWWSSSVYSSTTAWYLFMGYNYSYTCRLSNPNQYGFSVRCLKD
jgi:uncharacterized protein (TIGR02145 family)